MILIGCSGTNKTLRRTGSRTNTMKRYIGRKEINAIPMNRQAYNDFRGWKLPADENGADEGYLVEYVDGGKANTPQYKGYVSWSPKEVFEKAYNIADTVKDRLIIEHKELGNKLEKLFDFIENEKFNKIIKDRNQRDLFFIQYDLMHGYFNLLHSRIESMKE